MITGTKQRERVHDLDNKSNEVNGKEKPQNEYAVLNYAVQLCRKMQF